MNTEILEEGLTKTTNSWYKDSYCQPTVCKYTQDIVNAVDLEKLKLFSVLYTLHFTLRHLQSLFTTFISVGKNTVLFVTHITKLNCLFPCLAKVTIAFVYSLLSWIVHCHLKMETSCNEGYSVVVKNCNNISDIIIQENNHPKKCIPSVI